jgi:peptidoglycan/LPS O-acetylase OafA/YrhL
MELWGLRSGATVHEVLYDVTKLLVLIAAVFVISLLLNAYYETPARKWLRRCWRGFAARAALAEASQSPTS